MGQSINALKSNALSVNQPQNLSVSVLSVHPNYSLKQLDCGGLMGLYNLQQLYSLRSLQCEPATEPQCFLYSMSIKIVHSWSSTAEV